MGIFLVGLLGFLAISCFIMLTYCLVLVISGVMSLDFNKRTYKIIKKVHVDNHGELTDEFLIHHKLGRFMYFEESLYTFKTLELAEEALSNMIKRDDRDIMVEQLKREHNKPKIVKRYRF